MSGDRTFVHSGAAPVGFAVAGRGTGRGVGRGVAVGSTR